MIYAVVLAGGGGTRLWPESRQNRPKQFFRLRGETTILAETVARVSGWIAPHKILISTGESMTQMVSDALPRFPRANILAEPCSRNTAPAIGLAALEVMARDPNGIMIVMPSDHLIDPADRFCETLQAAVDLINEDPDRIVTLGIRPTRPATGFGYIQTAGALDTPAALENRHKLTAFAVGSFHEKPDRQTAENYLASGEYLWNAGIFVWKARRILELLDTFQPEIGRRLEAIRTPRQRTDSADFVSENYAAMPSVSIDLAILEKADHIVTLAAPLIWNDIGSFESLGEALASDRDTDGNYSLGIRLMPIDAKGNIVRWNAESKEQSGELMALVGVEDLEIVRQGNAILITKKGSEALLRQLVAQLRAEGLDEYL